MLVMCLRQLEQLALHWNSPVLFYQLWDCVVPKGYPGC